MAADTPSRRATVRVDRRALTCCVVATLALAGALGFVLSHAGPHRAGTNGVFSQATVVVPAGRTVCQRGELLPAGTETVAITGGTFAPPLVELQRHGQILDRVDGTVDRAAGVIRAPIARPSQTLDDVEVCLTMRADAALGRGPTPPGVGTAVAGRPLPDSSLAISYLTRPSAWWGFAATIADRLCADHAKERFCWVIWSVAGLWAAALVLTGWIVVRALVRNRPPAHLGLAIATIAVLNAGAWAVITPPFQVPDEVGHVAYVQSLGEQGHPPPHPPALALSPEQATAMADSGFGKVAALTYRSAAWSRQRERALAYDGRRPLSRRQTIAAGEAEPEPPLYYALEAIPYRLAHGASLLDRMLLMRLASALLAGATALLSFLFVRECVPAKPWAWATGGLAVALMPMLGFIAGGVNPDALLFAIAAGLFVCLARAWRRGVTMRLALAVGALIAAAMLTKVNAYGLVPGALLGLALATRRTTLAWDRRLMRLLAGATLVAGGLFVAGAAFEALVWHRSIFAARPIAPESHVGLWAHVGYLWQVFLPRLPFQPATELSAPGYQELFESFVGGFGQLVVWFPAWVYRLVALGLVLLGLLVARMLHAEPRELRWRRGELLGYGAMAAGLMLLVALSADLRRNLVVIVQGRYLLPLLPLLGLLLALAARGAGERWGRSTGVAIVSTLVALGLFGQLMTLAWFYA